MKLTKKQMISQHYRVISSRKKNQSINKDRPLFKPSNKKLNQTKLTQAMPRHLSSESEEHAENDMSLCSDMETIEEEELDQGIHQNPATSSLKTIMRPLLQLFSEDSAAKTPANAREPPKNDKPPVIYKSISLSTSDEEESDHEEQNKQPIEFEALSPVNGEPNRSSRFISIDEDKPNLKLTRFTWSPKTTNIFLNLWEKHLTEFRGNRKKSHIHKEMAQEMIEYGPSDKEVKHKMDNMSKKYRLEAIKVKNGESTNWRYYKRVKFLLIGTSSVDFEDIIFENTDSGSDASSQIKDKAVDNNFANTAEKKSMPMESVEKALEEDDVKEPEDVKEFIDDDPPLTLRGPQESRYTTNERMEPPADRMLQIEEEKLVVEKQKLRVMEHMSRELSSISKALNELLRNAKK